MLDKLLKNIQPEKETFMNIHEEYRRRLVKLTEFADLIENGWVCCTDIAAAIPAGIMKISQ